MDENRVVLRLGGTELSEFLDWRVNKESEAIGRGEECENCKTNGYGLYADDRCARCGYTAPSGSRSGWR